MSKTVMQKAEAIDAATQQFKEFLEKNFNGKKIRVGAAISIATKGIEIDFTLQSPSKNSPAFASEKNQQVTKISHLNIISEQTFESIRDLRLRLIGREIIQIIATSNLKTITASELIATFNKNDFKLGGKNKQHFHGELARINHVLIREYGCRIIRYNGAEFGTSPTRHFALFMTTTKKVAAEEEG